MYHPSSIWRQKMDLNPINYKPDFIFLWCWLNSDGGKGLTGLISIGTIAKLLDGIWHYPKTTSVIVTIVNKYNRQKRTTCAFGIAACVAIVAFWILMFVCGRFLQAVGSDCDATKAPDSAVACLLALLVTALLAVAATTTFYARKPVKPS